MESKNTSTDTQQKLAWNAPQIQVLDVSLDTSFGTGSGGDGAFLATTIGPEETPIP